MVQLTTGQRTSPTARNALVRHGQDPYPCGGEPAPVRHRDQEPAGLRPAARRGGVDVRLWRHGAGHAAHRARPLRRSTSTCCAAGSTHRGYDVDARAQRHRHRRQDPRQGRRGRPAVVGVGRHPRARLRRRLRRRSAACRRRSSRGPPGTSRDGRADASGSSSAGTPTRPAATSTSRCAPSPTTGRCPASGSTRSPRARPTCGGKRDPRDFTLWKGAKPGEPSWPTPWGPRPSRLAPGVLGDGHRLPRRRVRHPRRRARPGLPAPRERARPVARRRRRVRPVLAAQRLGHHGRREDVQVAGQHALDRRHAAPGPRRRAALLPGRPALPVVIEYSDAALDEAVAAYRRIESFVHRVRERVGTPEPGALSAGVRRGDGRRPGHAGGAGRRPQHACATATRALDAGDRAGAPCARPPSVRAMPGVLGLDPLDPQWAERRRLGDAAAARAQRPGRRPARAAPGGARPARLRRRRRHPRPAAAAGIVRRGHARRSHVDAQGRAEHMAGNSKRRGAMRKDGHQEGRGRRLRRAAPPGAKGKGPTPPAESAPAIPAARKAASGAAPGSPAKVARQAAGCGPAAGRATARPRRPCSAATRSWSACAPGCRRPRCTSRSAPRPTSGSPRPCSWPPTPGSRSSRCPAATWTGWPAGALHQGLALQVPPYEYAHPDDLLEQRGRVAPSPR